MFTRLLRKRESLPLKKRSAAVVPARNAFLPIDNRSSRRSSDNGKDGNGSVRTAYFSDPSDSV
ncbi:MAG TPA: hypothetical protein VMV10_05600 [Pirellulales bacterium]|nr:hypothetical protein [Pirellulales bacterium]